MSTKIYTGFRIHQQSASQLHSLMEQLRAIVRPQADAGLRRFAVNAMVRQSDEHLLLTPIGPKPNIAHQVLDNLRERHQKFKTSPFRDPAIDFTFEIVFFPVGRWLLGIPCTEQEGFREELLKLPGVEDYAYWNNTDPPADVPEKVWKKRRQDWEKALRGPCPTLAYNGFTFQIADPSPFFFYNELTENLLPTLDQRVKWAADAVALKEKWKAPEDSSKAMSDFIQFSNWCRFEEEGKAYMDGLRADLRIRLQQHPISIKELLGLLKPS